MVKVCGCAQRLSFWLSSLYVPLLFASGRVSWMLLWWCLALRERKGWFCCGGKPRQCHGPHHDVTAWEHTVPWHEGCTEPCTEHLPAQMGHSVQAGTSSSEMPRGSRQTCSTLRLHPMGGIYREPKARSVKGFDKNRISCAASAPVLTFLC